MLPSGPELSPQETSFQWFARPFEFLLECQAQFGDAFVLEFKDFGRHLFVSDPASVEAVFRGPHEELQGGLGNRILKAFLGPGSLLLLDGKAHSAERTRLRPLFHRDKLAAFAPRITAIVNDELDKLEADQVLSLPQFLARISQRIIVQFVFQPSADNERTMMTAIDELMSVINRGYSFQSDEDIQANSLHEKLKDARRALALAIFDCLQEPSNRNNLFRDLPSKSILSDIGGQDPGIDQVITILLAGHETTVTTLSWIFKALSSHPQVSETLIRELESVGPPPQKAASNSYLLAVIRESLRLYPPIPVVSRQLRSTFRCDRWTLSPGMHVTPCVFLSHRNPKVFENPSQFEPERFHRHRYTAYEYYPFGGGKRRCIGRDFALLELPLVLSAILKRVRWTFLDEAPTQGMRRSVTVAPTGTRVRVSSLRRQKLWSH